MPNRCDNEIRGRWLTIIHRKKSIRASPKHWTADEDERLKCLVAEHGGKDWQAIATQMQDRNNTQCWHRWKNYLTPQLNRRDWTTEEDQQIWNGVMNVGTKWGQIRKLYLPNRNYNDISRRFMMIIQKSHAPSGQEWNTAELEMRAPFLNLSWRGVIQAALEKRKSR